MITLKIITILLCSGLFWYGGYKNHNMRRFVMPTLLTIVCWYLTRDIWALTMLSSMAFLTMGYGEKSPLRHIFGDGWGRGIWGLLVALALSLGLFITNHMNLIYFLVYLGINFTLENALKKMNQFIGDPIIGVGFSIIVFLIK